MAQEIKDGTGTGNKAKVDDHGRLTVAANMISHMQHHATFHKNLYILNFNTILSGSNEKPIAFFKNNDGSKDFEFYHILISSDANIKTKWRFGDEYTSGGSIVSAVNTNRGSGATLSTSDVDIYAGGSSDNLILDSTNGFMFTKNWLPGYMLNDLNFDGSLIIPSNRTASMLVTGAIGQEVNVTVFVASHNAGTKL